MGNGFAIPGWPSQLELGKKSNKLKIITKWYNPIHEKLTKASASACFVHLVACVDLTPCFLVEPRASLSLFPLKSKGSKIFERVGDLFDAWIIRDFEVPSSGGSDLWALVTVLGELDTKISDSMIFGWTCPLVRLVWVWRPIRDAQAGWWWWKWYRWRGSCCFCGSCVMSFEWKNKPNSTQVEDYTEKIYSRVN